LRQENEDLKTSLKLNKESLAKLMQNNTTEDLFEQSIIKNDEIIDNDELKKLQDDFLFLE